MIQHVQLKRWTSRGASRLRRPEGTPLITIAVPAYNRPSMLLETLTSIAAQTIRVPIEVIVCDDGGLERTRDMVRQFPTETFTYLRNLENLGAVQNWNRCLRAARGEWVMVLHEDDALYPWYLECVLPHLNGDAAAVCTKTSRGAVMPTECRPVVSPPVRTYPPQYFLKSSMTPFPGVLVRRDVALRLGGFDDRWGPIADYEFWYRLACAGPVKVVRAVGAFYRVAPGQWTERVWGRMLSLAHLLRLKIAREQFPNHPRSGRWLARFFTYGNARAYAARFGSGPAGLGRCLGLGRGARGRMPSGWVWQALKVASRTGWRQFQLGPDAKRAPQIQQVS